MAKDTKAAKKLATGKATAHLELSIAVKDFVPDEELATGA